MPCHNSAATIRGAIESVIKQSSGDWELIIVNDGSIDNTRQIIKEYAGKDKRIKVLEWNGNKGVATARNAGIEMSSYTYIGFLDSDDTLDERFVERMLETAYKFNCDIVWGQYKLTNNDEDSLRIVDNNIPKNEVFSNIHLLKSFYNSTPGIASLCNKIYSRNYIDRELPTRFNPERRRAEDWEFNLTLFQKTGNFVSISDSLYIYDRSAKTSAMKTFIDNDFPLMLRSIELLLDCNIRNNLGICNKEIYKNTGYPIFEHLFHSTLTNSYISYRLKIKDEKFKDFLIKTNLSSLPLSYKLPALFIKFNMPKIAYLFSKVLNMLL